MDIEVIDKVICELEESETSFDNVRELACLYIVRNYLKAPNENKALSVEFELDDILPRYKDYCNIKRRFQLNEIDNSAVLKAMSRLCLEIQEFIQSLYSSTDFPDERKLIYDMLEHLSNNIKTE